jgi:hypothetical protein
MIGDSWALGRAARQKSRRRSLSKYVHWPKEWQFPPFATEFKHFLRYLRRTGCIFLCTECDMM